MPGKRITVFPKKVFVKIMCEREPCNDYLAAEGDLQDLRIPIGEVIDVATYELVKIARVEHFNQIIGEKKCQN